MRIAVANSKGGVGKSTLTVVLADFLAVRHHLNILVIDLDPQATSSCLLKSVAGVELARQQRQTLAHFLEKMQASENDVPSLADFRQVNASNLIELKPGPEAGHRGRIDLIASVPSLWFEEHAFIERYYSAGQKPTDQLYEAFSTGLETISDQYHVVLIDCPPNYSSLTRAGLMLANVVISPTTADEIALMSLKDFRTHAIDAFPDGRFNKHHYVAVTRFGRTKEEGRMLSVMKKSFDVLDPPIRYSTQIARAVWRVAPSSTQKYREKYGSFLSGARSDIEALGKTVYEQIIQPTQ